jgi:hypothetical protein
MNSEIELPEPWGRPIKMLQEGRQTLGMAELEDAIVNSGVCWDEQLPRSLILQLAFGTYLGWCARLESVRDQIVF